MQSRKSGHGIFTGWWSVLFIGIYIAGSGMIFMYFITEVWHYYIAWGAMIGLGYNIAFITALVFAAVVTLLMFFLQPPKPPLDETGTPMW